MAVSIALLLVIVAVVSFFIIASKEEVTGVSKLRNVYLYLVSFTALMLIVGGLIFTVQNITDVLFPTNYSYEPIPLEKTADITAEDKKIMEENRLKMEENRKTDSKKNVAKSVAVVIVALPVFFYHWRKIEKEKMGQV